MEITKELDISLSKFVREWKGNLPPLNDQSIHQTSRNFWTYRGEWDHISSRYQTLVSKLPHRFQMSPIFLGVEIEVEDVQQIPSQQGSTIEIPGFFVHQDGSLRNGLEFVTSPLPVSQLVLALVNLDHWMKKSLIHTPSFSWRTSNHVHLNVRDMSLGDLGKLILLYSIFELQMFKYAGESRLNSVFCVPLTKTNLHTNIHHVLSQAEVLMFSRDGGWDKYCALGIFRLFDLGTVEFRHFPGGFDVERLVKWVSFILSLRVAASSLSWDRLLYYVKNLNTLCNYRELQTLVFGQDLADDLGTPETSVQMLSNGVTFAKKCLISSSFKKPKDGSCLREFMENLVKEQAILIEKHANDPNVKAVKGSIYTHDFTMAPAQPNLQGQNSINTLAQALAGQANAPHQISNFDLETDLPVMEEHENEDSDEQNPQF